MCGSSNVARACSCFGLGPACTEVWSNDVDAVFLGTVESKNRALPFEWFPGELEPSAEPFGGMVDVTFAVQEVYKGAFSKKLVVRTRVSDARCGVRFECREQYLVFASKQNGQLYTSICQRTRLARLAAADLEYLRQMQSMPDTSQIFGSYKRYTRDPDSAPPFTPSITERDRDKAPMTGETVTVIGRNGQAFTTKVDAEGRFLLSNLPPGRYAMKASAPPKLAQPTSDSLDWSPRGVLSLPSGRSRTAISLGECSTSTEHRWRLRFAFGNRVRSSASTERTCLWRIPSVVSNN
jgi:hypothetical protein